MVEAARVLSVSPGPLTRLCVDGRLPARLIDESWRMEVDVVATFQRTRDQLKSAARETVMTSERRRRTRAAAAANIQ